MLTQVCRDPQRPPAISVRSPQPNPQLGAKLKVAVTTLFVWSIHTLQTLVGGTLAQTPPQPEKDEPSQIVDHVNLVYVRR
jgi:hypothetical protein